ncbi:protein of unknown function DUF86 [Desulfonatronospira thiodismutans ASO3-1]|uniref:DUF86 domain-containing protein n=1 Tax=Desulfonatronospira thiodismutans ASO3-1 TaxID=555779 RepID=D6SNC1_9BACT|nr:DUF86 domain-containing protein [Desulfonatronospira thiodismutans]EFI34247.1 protein of unknown function DUF86 [Desulfonatronospira thiodismutans ASO3-1]
MVDRNIILSKMAAVQKHVRRVKTKRDIQEHEFLQDLDRQESILFNLQMAIQNCIDLAAHVVSEKDLGLPGSTNEIFYLLEDQGYIHQDLTERMVKATGFRNLLVHEYGEIDLKVVFKVSHEDVEDLEEFARVLGDLFG